MEFKIIEIIIIILLSAFQSVFGVGLLLYGTPLFLVLGNDFLYSLHILLPISITISFLQIRNRKVSFSIPFLTSFNFLTLPVLILTLIFLIFYYNSININLIVGLVIISFSLINIFFKKIISIFIRVKFIQNIIFIFIGLIHGLTNLGGSLLAITSTQMNTSKEVMRYCIAYGYLVMGTLQLIMIYSFSDREYNYLSLLLIIIPILIYKISQKIFLNFSSNIFNLFLNVITLIFGIYILFTFFN